MDKTGGLEIASIKRECVKRASEEERRHKEKLKREKIDWTE